MQRRGDFVTGLELSLPLVSLLIILLFFSRVSSFPFAVLAPLLDAPQDLAITVVSVAPSD